MKAKLLDSDPVRERVEQSCRQKHKKADNPDDSQLRRYFQIAVVSLVEHEEYSHFLEVALNLRSNLPDRSVARTADRIFRELAKGILPNPVAARERRIADERFQQLVKRPDHDGRNRTNQADCAYHQPWNAAHEAALRKSSHEQHGSDPERGSAHGCLRLREKEHSDAGYQGQQTDPPFSGYLPVKRAEKVDRDRREKELAGDILVAVKSGQPQRRERIGKNGRRNEVQAAYGEKGAKENLQNCACA